MRSEGEDREDWESGYKESESERNRSGIESGNRIGRDEESVVCGLENGSVKEFGFGNGRGELGNGLEGQVNEMVRGP